MKHTLTLITAFLIGACTGASALSVAGERPTFPPATASTGATVTEVTKAEARQLDGGKATIRFLAHGQNAWLGRLTLAAGGKVPAHRDPTEEFIHVITGGGTIHIDGKSHILVPGSTVYMPAGAQVSYDNGSERLVALQVFAGPKPAAKYSSWKAVSP